MGTRSLTVVQELDGAEVMVLYRQWDGHIETHGKELASFLQSFKIVNGISNYKAKKQANGMRCLAAQLVAELKDGIGNLYIYPTKSRDCDEEYLYYVRPTKDGKVTLEVKAPRGWDKDYTEGETIYKGSCKGLLAKARRIEKVKAIEHAIWLEKHNAEKAKATN